MDSGTDGLRQSDRQAQTAAQSGESAGDAADPRLCAARSSLCARSRDSKPAPPPRPPSAALRNDLQAFDPGGVRWTDLSEPAHGAPPPPRGAHGVAAAAGGGVFVFGGSGACPAGDGCLGA